jgi:hypothetical protein
MSVNGITGRSGTQIQSLLAQKQQLDDLQRQLGTGQKSTTYAGLGLDRSLSVALRTQLATLQTYQQSSAIIGTRLTVAQTALTQVAKSGSTVKSATENSVYSIDQSGQTTDQDSAKAQLDLIISALNSQVGDQYIFSGKSPDVQPVETLDHILNGDGTRAGYNQIVAERKLADLGSNGLGRLTLPPIVSSAASMVGSGATLNPDAVAVVAGSQNIGGAYSSAGGTLVINGTTVNIAAGANSAAVLAAINAPAVVAATGVTASLNGSNNLVLTSANASTAIDVGAGSTLLGELGLSATITNPTNLLTQGAVTAGQTLTVTIGANPPLTVTFGLNTSAIPPEVATLAQLNAQLTTLVGNGASAASVNPANGNITITATTTGDAITVGGNANAAAFGLATTTATPSNSVSVSEDVAGHPFGFKLASYNSTLSGSTVTTGGPPAQYTVNMGANPTAGQTITFNFNLPDGSKESLTLTATTANPPGANAFTIGATPDVTAANFKAALTSSISNLADTSLTAASAVAASNDFFKADGAGPPQRVGGPSFATATTLVAGTSSNTVSWYRGESGSTPARSTATAQADTSISVSFGARANEQALRNTVANIAAFASMTFSATDPNASLRYGALKQRVGTNLSDQQGVQKVSDIEAELANAQTTLSTAKDRQQQTNSVLTDMLQSITGVSTDEVGVQILNLQTRLQASLQTTALLSKTSLVNYL